MSRPDLRLAERGGWIESLRAPAALFSGVARARGALYDRGWLRSTRVSVPVLSVGNLSVGGTGKTPMIAWLGRRLLERGKRVGLASRGYGAVDGAPNDEAKMLAALLPGVPHAQDRDRVAAAEELVRGGVDVVLLDDGFQHRRLARDVDIVLVDALRPFGLPAPFPGGEPVRALLPRGLMREPLGALRRADAVVITRSDAVAEEELEDLVSLLMKTAPGLPVARSVHEPVRLRAFASGATLDPSELEGRDVALFSGIGNPAAFEVTIRALGARVRKHTVFDDHHSFRPGDLDELGAKGHLVVTTAKDAARLDRLDGASVPPRLHVLDVELRVTSGAAVLDALLDGLDAPD